MAKLTGSRKLNIVSGLSYFKIIIVQFHGLIYMSSGCVRVYSLGSIIPSSDTEEALYPISFRLVVYL